MALPSLVLQRSARGICRAEELQAGLGTAGTGVGHPTAWSLRRNRAPKLPEFVWEYDSSGIGLWPSCHVATSTHYSSTPGFLTCRVEKWVDLLKNRETGQPRRSIFNMSCPANDPFPGERIQNSWFITNKQKHASPCIKDYHSTFEEYQEWGTHTGFVWTSPSAGTATGYLNIHN